MEEKNDDFELVVSQQNHPIWMKVIAALFFAAILYFLYRLSMVFYDNGFTEDAFRLAANSIQPIIYCLAGGIIFSITKTVLIDTHKHILISRFCVGPFSHDAKSKVPELEYVSVFFDSGDSYEVNLWYVGNKHYNMYYFDEKEPAMEFGQMVSEKLNLDLLDATEKGNSKWVEKA